MIMKSVCARSQKAWVQAYSLMTISPSHAISLDLNIFPSVKREKHLASVMRFWRGSNESR